MKRHFDILSHFKNKVGRENKQQPLCLAQAREGRLMP